MDFNGDRRNDILSGSYNPGHIFLFEQQEDGTYAEPVRVCDEDGTPILVGNAAHANAADWDSDGDLDLVIGNISGEVYFVRNRGDARHNAFGSPQALSVETPEKRSFVDGLKSAIGLPSNERVSVPGGDAGPVLADWDQDGLLDLIVGAGDGSVLLYRNIGSKTSPKLSGAVTLLPSRSPSDGDGRGTRSKVCITDFNDDGLLDLLVGDFAYVQSEVEVSADQQAEIEEAKKQYQDVRRRYSVAYRKTELPKLYQEYRKLSKSGSVDDGQDERTEGIPR